MAREAGRIGVTEILVGVPFPALAFEIVRASVPPRYLPKFTLSGATSVTDEALKRGWVDELAEPADLMDDAMAVAKELSLLSPAAFAQTKMQIRQPVVERLQKSGKTTDDAVIEIWAAPATLAYIRNYVAQTLGKS
jgi:enoyl-CoA hydratase